MILNVVVALIGVLVATPFPQELVAFAVYPGNPVFTGAAGQWDARIRERGWIMAENGQYRMWYTGYATEDGRRLLGHATSPDGITCARRAESDPPK